MPSSPSNQAAGVRINIFLLCLFLPVHIFLAPGVVAYELAAICFEQHIGNPSMIRLILRDGPVFLIGWASHILNLVGPVGMYTKLGIKSLQHLLWTAFCLLLWQPLSQALRYAFNRINSRLYHAIPIPSGNFIRVLEIAAGAPSDDLSVHIKCVSLDDSQTVYEALSYSWGHSLFLRRIIHVNGHKFLVTDSAFRAMKDLRMPDSNRILWIDSVCINQASGAEKNDQVQRMHAIYTHAIRVIVWLGTAPKRCEDLLVAMRMGLPNGHWVYSSAIQTLLRLRWWSRIWVIQEVALAKDVVFRFGQEEVAWGVMADLLRNLEAVLQSRPFNNRVLHFIRTVENLQSEPYNLFELAIRFRTHVATDPRDKIYGLSALARVQNEADLILPDYSLSAEEVFTQIAAMYMVSSQNLAPLALAESRPTAGCSWAADWHKWTDKSWSSSDPFSYEPYNAEKQDCVPLWSDGLLPSIDSYCNYRAAGDLSKSCKEGSLGAILLRRVGWEKNGIECTTYRPGKPRFLRLTGWVTDSINSVGVLNISEIGSSRTVMKNINKKWRPLMQSLWRPSSETSTSISYEATFLNCIFTGAVPDWPKTECESAEKFFEMVKDTQLPGSDIVFNVGFPRTTFANILNLLVACCYGRRLFMTRNGRFGLGPGRCKPSDLVCMVAGCPVPIVLGRRRRTPKDCYEYIGQAYLDGAMEYEGDLEADITAGKVKLREFVLC